jgi:hypothetical protein
MKEKFLAILAALGFTDKAKTPDQFTAEELRKLDAKCQEELKLSFAETLTKIVAEENDKAISLNESQKSIFAALFGETTTIEVNGEGTETTDNETEEKDPVQAINKLKTTVTEQQKQIDALGKKPETTTSKKVEGKIVKMEFKHTKTHLFGAEHDFFSMSKPWNAIMVHRKPLEIVGQMIGINSDWTEYADMFKKDFKAYAQSFAARIAQHQMDGTLSTLSATGIDFTGFDSTGWGEQHLVRRQDALIAFIRSLPRLDMFPIRYGVQDKEVLTNSFFTELSSPWISGRVFKGSVSVQPMLAEVFDVMFKHKFSDLKQLEREFIGYLNRENSDPIKWTWIEWVIANMMKILVNEQNIRRIDGYRAEPINGAVGSFLTASNGVKRALRFWSYEEFRIKPSADFGVYTSSTMLTTVEGFIKHVNAIQGINLDGWNLYINDKHVNWYLSLYRAAYGLQQDFAGSKLKVMDFPNINLVPVGNMGNSCFLILTMPGNIEFLENAAGEMAKMYFQQDMDELMVRSVWKEGVTAYMVGKKYATATARDADAYKYQFIFTNEPITSLAAGATTVDGSVNDWFKTVANSGATAITDITSADYGRAYRIICGSATNATTIAKSGKFSAISATWTPTAVGDFLEVYLFNDPNDDTNALNGKFIELKRKVTA